MSQQLLLVNYHYVREPHAHPYPGIHPISPDAFTQQIKGLAAQFHIATPEEVEAFVLQGRALPRDSVLITFDDGLVDHAETARHILDPMGVKAVFFVCSRPLTEERAVSVHKIHWLRATTEPDAFPLDLLACLPEEWRDATVSDDEKNAGPLNLHLRPSAGRRYQVSAQFPASRKKSWMPATGACWHARRRQRSGFLPAHLHGCRDFAGARGGGSPRRSAYPRPSPGDAARGREDELIAPTSDALHRLPAAAKLDFLPLWARLGPAAGSRERSAAGMVSRSVWP